MIRLVSRLLMIGFVLFSSACHKHLPSTDANTTLACKQQCAQHLSDCTSTCHNNCASCLNKSVENAHRAFSTYVHEQKLRGCDLSRELNSYLDPLQCRKVTCSCLDDYHTCKAAC